MHLNVYAVFYSLNSNQHVSATTAAIFRVILLQEYKGTNVVSCVDKKKKKLKIIIISVTII
jgi:hypothetical protein